MMGSGLVAATAEYITALFVLSLVLWIAKKHFQKKNGKGEYE